MSICAMNAGRKAGSMVLVPLPPPPDGACSQEEEKTTLWRADANHSPSWRNSKRLSGVMISNHRHRRILLLVSPEGFDVTAATALCPLLPRVNDRGPVTGKARAAALRGGRCTRRRRGLGLGWAGLISLVSRSSNKTMRMITLLYVGQG